MEREVPRRGAPVLAGRRRRGFGAGDRASRAAAISTSRADDGPYASINFITAHDGFTLADLVSYNTKRNRRQRRTER
jgi:glycogen operon protein